MNVSADLLLAWALSRAALRAPGSRYALLRQILGSPCKFCNVSMCAVWSATLRVSCGVP